MCEIIKKGSHYTCYGKLVNHYDLILDESYEYKGDHPLACRDHYENILEERGLIEMCITDVKVEDGKLIISYEEQ